MTNELGYNMQHLIVINNSINNDVKETLYETSNWDVVNMTQRMFWGTLIPIRRSFREVVLDELWQEDEL